MGVQDVKTVRFGPFELDMEREELRQDGEPLLVQPQPMRVLAILIGQGGKLISREELRRRVWGEGSLHDGRDHSLNHSIRKLRQVLGDSARQPVFIQTVPRRGYRFIAQTQLEPRQSAKGAEGGLSLDEVDVEGGPLRLRVMPFRDIAEHGPLPPLADGTVHELISALVRLQNRGVIVIDPLPEHQELVVEPGARDFRLQGAVRVTGGHVRIHAYLVRGRDDRVLGTAVFEERFAGLFELQRTIAERIVESLVEPLLEQAASED